MNNFQTERKAIYSVAHIITELNWIFREQPNVDYGVDAFVETTVDNWPSGRYIALQIKGGEKNFHRSKNNLTFYFSERHYIYWSSISERLPVLIVIQDPITNTIYWQHFTKSNASETNKRWKITIPIVNVLNASAKETIEEIVHNNQGTLPSFMYNKFICEAQNERLSFKYLFPSGKLHSLTCEVKIYSESILIETFYVPINWDTLQSKMHWDDPYYFTLLDFEKLVEEIYNDCLINNIAKSLTVVKKNIDKILVNGGIERLAEFIFDKNNSQYKIPKYCQFIEAFEFHTNLKRNQYQAYPVGHNVIFVGKDVGCELGTYEGKIAELKRAVDERLYDDICWSYASHWSEVFMDSGVEKEEFIPAFHKEWENYWDQLYFDIEQENGHIEHLKKEKERSWRLFDTFVKMYDDSDDIIGLAYKLDDSVFFPLAVIAMINNADQQACYSLYCVLEFENSDEWESICIDYKNLDAPIFYIRNNSTRSA